MDEYPSFANMTGWTIGWAALGFVTIARATKDAYPFFIPRVLTLTKTQHASWMDVLKHPATLSIFGWCVCGALHAFLKDDMWSVSLMPALALFAFSYRSPVIRLAEVQNNDSPESIHSRLIQLRLQLQRLHEKERLNDRLEKAEQSQAVLDRYEQRFHVILLTIENHLTFGDHGRAERIITLFARHLRHILYEGSVPFLTLDTTIEHIKTHLSLMELLTAGRFICDVDDGMLEASHLARCTESLRISPWVESMVWPFFEWAERNHQTIEPMQLLIDMEDGEILLTCAHPSLVDSQIACSKRLKLLGDYSGKQEEVNWGKTLKVVA